MSLRTHCCLFRLASSPTLRNLVTGVPRRRFLSHVPTRTPECPEQIDTTPSLTRNITPLGSSTLNAYTVSYAPSPEQLEYAHKFFSATAPTLLYTAAHFRSLPPSPFPEVAFLGRSNVGKSSLLNALFGRTRARDAKISKKPGKTQTLNGFGVPGPNNPLGPAPKDVKLQKETIWKRFPQGGIVVVDMPGYGAGSRESWGQEALKFLGNRKQLRRTFLLVDTEHGLKTSDVQIITHLQRNGIPFQIVLSKVDKLLYPMAKKPGVVSISNRLERLRTRIDQVRDELNAAVGDGRDRVGDILCCSAEKSLTAPSTKLGVNEVRWAVLNACGVESDLQGQKKRRISRDSLAMDRQDATSIH